MFKFISFIQTLIALFIGVSAWRSTEAEEMMLQKDFTEVVSVPRIGKVDIVYQVTGEPPVQPALLQIKAKCKGDKELKVVNEIPMCGLRDHKYDSRTHVLSISLILGRVDKTNGDSHCDVKDEREINLARICNSKGSK